MPPRPSAGEVRDERAPTTDGETATMAEEQGAGERDPGHDPGEVVLRRAARPDARDEAAVLAQLLGGLVRLERERRVEVGEARRSAGSTGRRRSARSRLKNVDDRRRRSSATIGTLEVEKYGASWLREQQDADREDDRDDAGLVDPQRQERLAALVHPPAADAAGVLDRDPPLAFLDVDDHARPRRSRRSRSAMRERDVRAAGSAPSALGARLTMPAKMMKLMPLPMPRSVISSPSHIRTIAPAVSVAIWVSVVEARQVERAGQRRPAS